MTKDIADSGVAAEELLAEAERRLSYDPVTGKLFWRSHRCPAYIGREAGHVRRDGYIVLHVNGRMHLAHRIAWLLRYWAEATGMIDHINGDRSDNRISNLRQASHAANLWNMRGHADAELSKGVSEDRRYPGTFYARLCKHRRHIHLGTFRSEAEAHAAYAAAAKSHFGDFARAS